MWHGVPDLPIEKLSGEINAALVNPKVTAQLAELGGTALPGSPAGFGKLIAKETAKWARVVKFGAQSRSNPGVR